MYIASLVGATKKLLKQISSEHNVHIEEATVTFPVQTEEEVCVDLGDNSLFMFSFRFSALLIKLFGGINVQWGNSSCIHVYILLAGMIQNWQFLITFQAIMVLFCQ